jgi:hypothetical protein
MVAWDLINTVFPSDHTSLSGTSLTKVTSAQTNKCQSENKIKKRQKKTTCFGYNIYLLEGWLLTNPMISSLPTLASPPPRDFIVLSYNIFKTKSNKHQHIFKHSFF